MEAFNSMPEAPPSATPGSAMAFGPGTDNFDQIIFDDSLMDSVNPAFPVLPFTPSYDFHDLSVGFEDPFSYTDQQFESSAPPDDAAQDSPTQELDNKLLGFTAPVSKAALLDEAGNPIDMSTMSAELRGMFFVAEDVFGGENVGRPLELTCYRRNLWQCLGRLTLPRHVSHVMDEQGNKVLVTELAASMGAVESIDGKAAEIIAIPWKTAPVSAEDMKITNTPAVYTLDLGSGQEVDDNRVQVNMVWKRLQFKHATANNGRRKGLQQHYLVHIQLLAKVPTGDYMTVAEIQSSPVIVRGRSPRNFDNKKDISLTSEKKRDKRNSLEMSPQRKDSNGQSTKLERHSSIGSSSNPSEWITSQPSRDSNGSQPHPKRLAMSPTMTRPPVPVPAWSADPVARLSYKASASTGSIPRTQQSGPISLSLSEDERSPNTSSTGLQSPRFGKGVAAVRPATSQSPKDDEEMLYEYFPLSVDDWMPPVEAVYRPHVVHHTSMPSEIKAQQLRSKMKRYFTAEL